MSHIKNTFYDQLTAALQKMVSFGPLGEGDFILGFLVKGTTYLEGSFFDPVEDYIFSVVVVD